MVVVIPTNTNPTSRQAPFGDAQIPGVTAGGDEDPNPPCGGGAPAPGGGGGGCGGNPPPADLVEPVNFPVGTDPFQQMLDRIGCNMDLRYAVTHIEGISSMHELGRHTKSDLVRMCNMFRKPGGKVASREDELDYGELHYYRTEIC
jgi:hypothetical protein